MYRIISNQVQLSLFAILIDYSISSTQGRARSAAKIDASHGILSRTLAEQDISLSSVASFVFFQLLDFGSAVSALSSLPVSILVDPGTDYYC
jgi:hypothetical protein